LCRSNVSSRECSSAVCSNGAAIETSDKSCSEEAYGDGRTGSDSGNTSRTDDSGPLTTADLE
jgi:hypothetical protein